jgi:hypothetical protein
MLLWISSSSRTPEKYLNESRSVGYILAKRGRTCVNGAGSFECMAALNEGAESGNGHVVGVFMRFFLSIQPIRVYLGMVAPILSLTLSQLGATDPSEKLWEMACSRQIGLSTLPIVCVNVDGFYEPFRTMLELMNWASNSKFFETTIVFVAGMSLGLFLGRNRKS